MNSKHHAIGLIMSMNTLFWGRKWRNEILWHLKSGPLRFSELKKLMPNCSVKVLSEVLVEMVTHQLITRTQFEGIPVKVTYEIHPSMTDLLEVHEACIVAMAKYILMHKERLNVSPAIVLELESMI